MLVDIVVDLAKLFGKHFIGPTFEWPAKIDANQFAQYASVDSFSVVGWNSHFAAPVSCAFRLSLKDSIGPVSWRLVELAC